MIDSLPSTCQKPGLSLQQGGKYCAHKNVRQMTRVPEDGVSKVLLL